MLTGFAGQVLSKDADAELSATAVQAAYAALQADVGRPDLALLVSSPGGQPGLPCSA